MVVQDIDAPGAVSAVVRARGHVQVAVVALPPALARALPLGVDLAGVAGGRQGRVSERWNSSRNANRGGIPRGTVV